MSKRFTDKNVVITGAGGGLGRAAALGFASEGAHLVLCDINQKLMDETAALIGKDGGTSSTHAFDMADEAAIKAFGKALCAKHPRIDVLYNNAGIAYGEVNEGFAEVTLEKWTKFMAVNTFSALILSQALRPSLAAAKGAILNQSSMAAYMPANPYGVTKATLNALTYGMAMHFGPDGIRVNAIAPGIMETPANKSGLTAETYARVQGMQLLNLHGVPDDIVKLALFLASDDARFITNQVVACDAGNRMRGWRF